MKAYESLTRGMLLNFFLILFIFSNSNPVFGARYIVVSTTTSKAWIDAEWKTYPDFPNCTPCTPETALANAKAGDTVYFRSGQGGNYDIKPGDYWTIPKWNPSNSGTQLSPIIFRNFPKEIPILRNINTGCEKGDEPCKNPVIGSNQRDYIIWDGFQLGKTMDRKLEGNPQVRFDTCKGCVLRNCKIYLVNDYENIYKSNYTGVYIDHVHNTTIKNNFITGGKEMGEKEGDSHSAAILMYVATNTLIENNSIIYTANGINDKSTARNNIYRNNFLYETGTHGIWFGGATGEGSSAKGNKAYQNIIVSTNPYAKLIWIDDDSSGAGHGDDFEIYNNVLYAPRTIQAGIEADDATNDRYWNNVIFGNFKEGSIRMLGPNSRPAYMDYNIYYGTQRFLLRVYEPNTTSYPSLSSWQNSGELANGGSPDLHSVYANPRFVRPGGISPNDYKLKTDSPCKGTGKNGQDMGAYPLGAGQTLIGCYSTTTPAPPRNLRTK